MLYKLVVTTLFALGAAWFGALAANAISWRSWKLSAFYVAGLLAYIALTIWTLALKCQ